MSRADISPSLAVPLEHLCDPANWGYVSEKLEPMPAPMALDSPRNWRSAMGFVASMFRHKHYLSMQARLTVLASPSVCEAMAPYQSSVACYDLDMHSFGVERSQFALIDAERFRYFERGDGWGARFTTHKVTGALVTFDKGEA